MKMKAHAPEKPAEFAYIENPAGMAEVWIRKNIEQTTVPAESEAASGADNTEYVYDEVYFQTTDSRETVEQDIDSYWTTGSAWERDVPLTEAQKIASLQKELNRAQTDLAQAKTDNNMALAELTMAMAAMMGGAATAEGGDN